MNSHLRTALGVFSKIFLNAGEDLDPKFEVKIMENEIMANQVDWKDEHHLRFCDQTQIKKRFLPIKGSVNMRDIGGYTTPGGRQIKWDKIYRGEELCHLDQEGREQFAKLGVNYIFDLRNRDKALESPDPTFPGVTNINIPVLEGLEGDLIDFSYPNITDQLMRNCYTELVKKRGNQFAQILEVLLEKPEAKIYVHCTNGKDRTGLAILLIMLLANCYEDQCISEFSLSNYHVDKAFKLFDSKFLNYIGPERERLLYGTIGVDPDWLGLQLDYINHSFANIDDFLLRNSLLRKYDLAVIRDNILENIPAKKNKDDKTEV